MSMLSIIIFAMACMVVLGFGVVVLSDYNEYRKLQRKLEIEDWYQTEIGILVTSREGKIYEGMPKEQAWAEHHERMEELHKERNVKRSECQ